MASQPEEFGAKPASRGLLAAMKRGAAKRCPDCGRGRLFKSYVKTEERCSHCGLAFSGHRADDAPPYVTIMIVGHLVIPMALAQQRMFDPPMWILFGLWMPTILAATLWLLPVVKGALIGVQWANRMHGFGEDWDEAEAL